MARLEDLPEPSRSRIGNLPCPEFADQPWVAPKSMSERRVAVVSTAGLQRRGDHPFDVGGQDYRVIPVDTPSGDIIMSHVSNNFDRSGFQHDVDVALPIDRLRELAEAGTIGSVADYHYSFMGATDPELMRPHAERMIGLMKDDGVDTVLLVPI